MSQTLQPRLQEFTRVVLERRGALVEWADPGGEGLALLPPDTAGAIGSPEALRLSCDPGGEGLCVNLATDFLDRLQPLVDPEPRVALLRIPELYLKRAPMDEPVARAFTWQNAKVRVLGTEPQRIEYHAWYFLAALQSEDRWEELVRTTINSASGAEVDLPDPLSYMGPPIDQPLPPEWTTTPPDTYDTGAARAGEAVQCRSAPFVARLESRLERDRKRLHDYYNALLREGTSRRRRAPEDPDKVNAKRRAVKLELRRKLAELAERYRLLATLTPQALVRLEMPALAVRCEVHRKQARRVHTLYWNPLAKALEPIACAACARPIFSVHFTNHDVDPICDACAASW